MNYIKCSRIESSFKDDDLNMPKKGDCLLAFNDIEDMGRLFLKKHDDKIYYNQTDSSSRTSHKVTNVLLIIIK